MPEILVFRDESAWLSAMEAAIIDRMNEAASRGRREFQLCLAGGSTPGPLYRALASSPSFAAACEILQPHLWVGDEREVSAESPWRNGAMIAEAFGAASRPGRPKPPVLHLWPARERTRSAEEYSLELTRYLGSAPAFDVSILGLGMDGHTAGLFSREDVEKGRTSLTVLTTAPMEPRNRMSLSASLLARSGAIIIPVRGAEKRSIVEAVRSADKLPLTLVAGPRGSIFYLEC